MRLPTIGVLLGVPQPYGRLLDDVRRSLGGRPAETPAHITLVAPTAVADSARADVDAHLDSAAAATAPFEVRLRGTGTFRPVSPVVFIGVVAGISSCEVLATRLRAGPLRTEPSFPYHPHVTIAHGASDEVLDRAFEEYADIDATWRVTGFTVYERFGTAQWRAVREIPLGG